MQKPKTALLRKIARGEFLISIQIDPPGVSAKQGEFIDTLSRLREYGATLIDVNSSRRLSHDSIQLSVALAQMGFEVIPHLTTRDSSINGLINQVLAAYAWGKVENFLIITGDPYEASRAAIIPSRGVFQTDALGALKLFDTHLRKNEGTALPISFAASVNQNNPRSYEAGRLRKKEAAGADFYMSQPVFSEQQAEKLFRLFNRHSQKPLLVGIWPILHKRTLEAIWNGRIVGVTLPEATYREAIKYADDEDALIAHGLKEAYRLFALIKKSGCAAGVYIVAPLRNPLFLAPLLEKIF